jgi:hypothetical protein
MQVQLAQYQLDNITILDIMMNTLSAAEKLVFRNKEGKKYGYYDEYNSAQWKDTNQLIKELQIQKECLQSMIELYNKNSNNLDFEFPSNLSKEEIINDLKILRDEASKINYINSSSIISIYNDIIKVINSQKCGHYSVEQICANDNKNTFMNEEKIIKRAKNIMIAKDMAIKKDNENEKMLMNNDGKIRYFAHLYDNSNNEENNGFFKKIYLSFK